MPTTVTQRIIDLAYGGHPPSEIANLMGVSEAAVQTALRDTSKAPTGGVAPGSINQRAVDLAYGGHPIPQIANLTGLTENQVRGLLQDTAQTPSQSETALTGVSSTTAPGAGGAGALPATPKGYLTVRVNGTDQKLPYY